jgi:HEAT repeat protein
MIPAPETLSVPLPSVCFAAAFIAGAAWIARAIRRRARQGIRRSMRDLGESLRAFLDGRLDTALLARQAAAVDPGTFWSALEALMPERPAPPTPTLVGPAIVPPPLEPSAGDAPIEEAPEPGAARWTPTLVAGTGTAAEPQGTAPDPSPMRRLARALAGCPHLHDERTALRDDSPWRRELAARRLGLLPTHASRDALRQALEAGPELVTAAAAFALARHRDRWTLAWLIAHPESIARRTPRARVALLAAFGRSGVDDMAQALERGTSNPMMDRALIETLALARHAASIPAIERRLEDPEVEIRVASARALGRLGATVSVTSLMGALHDEAWPVRAQAARALGRIRAPIALIELPSRLTDPAWWVRRHAAYALAEFGEEGQVELRRIAGGSPDAFARDMAREVLEGGERARGFAGP